MKKKLNQFGRTFSLPLFSRVVSTVARTDRSLFDLSPSSSDLSVRHQSMSYEISLRGPWPLDRYEALKATLADLTALLAQLQFVLTTLRPAWRRALLKRTRLMDVRFVSPIPPFNIYLAFELTSSSCVFSFLAWRRPRRHQPLRDVPSLSFTSSSNHSLSSHRTLSRTVRLSLPPFRLLGRLSLTSSSISLLLDQASRSPNRHGLRRVRPSRGGERRSTEACHC